MTLTASKVRNVLRALIVVISPARPRRVIDRWETTIRGRRRGIILPCSPIALGLSYDVVYFLASLRVEPASDAHITRRGTRVSVIILAGS